MSLQAKLEAVIYTAEEPVTLAQLLTLFAAEALEHRAQRLGQSAPTLSFPEPEQDDRGEGDGEADARLTRLRDRQAREELREILAELTELYAPEERGLELREVAGGYRFSTKPLYHDAVRGLIRTLKPPLKLSLAALETLAVIAYKQPVTAPEISDVRGVDSAGVLGSLIARKLVTTAGRKAVIGRPILYKTTREFLLRFGLKDLNELPSMEEFERIAAVELTEPDPASDLYGDPTLANPQPAEQELEPTAAEAERPDPAELPSDPEAEARAQAEIQVDAEDTEAQTAPDLPGVTRDTHGQLPIQSSPAMVIRRAPEEDEAI
jgi:segregation and condensation protein B